MDVVILRKTGITVNKNGLGALPIQRISKEEAVHLLRKAYDHGIRFFDTARFYTDSEEKIDCALRSVREQVFVASKTMCKRAQDFWDQLHASLHDLNMEYLDLYQSHNPAFCPKPGDGSGLYEAMLEAREKGLTHHIGITNRRPSVTYEVITSGLYETLQFPFSYLSTEKELELVQLCQERQMGFIAMKGLSGGLITNSAAAYAFLAQFENVLPIWGVQKEAELDEFLSYIENSPILNEEPAVVIEKDRKELAEDFYRGCGYCMPCLQGIEIPTCARISLLIRRAPLTVYLDEENQQKMARIHSCVHCNHCSSYCSHGLDTPTLLEENLRDCEDFLEKRRAADCRSPEHTLKKLDNITVS